MIRRGAHREHGVALLALLAVIMLAASWLLVKQLNAETGGMAAARKVRNAEVLNRAKQALIGYVAAQAAKSGEDRPGALPCPEAAGNFNDPANEGTVAYPCTLPKVGRFPWRTLGLDKLVDASGEPLWYVVSPGWAGAGTVINSNSVGQLTVDGATNDAVALIIAPGPAIAVPAAAGCTAWTQTRPTSGTPDWRNYLECENATYPTPDALFVTTGPSGSFNDQVIKITAAELLPAIEAAIVSRIEREIAPALNTMYNGGSWSGSSATPRLPYAAAFADPTTSAMKGVAANFQGLLPLVYSETSPGSGVACAAGVRCDSAFVAWISGNFAGASMSNPSCAATPTQLNCSYGRVCFLFCGATTLSFTLTGYASNVGKTMRQLNSAATMTNVNAAGRTFSNGVLNPVGFADGAAKVDLAAQTNVAAGVGISGLAGNLLCGLPLGFLQVCKQETFSVPIAVFADHTLLDSTTTGAGALGWFLRNKWQEVTYYALAAGHAPSGAASCTTGGTCLTVNYHRDATNTADAGKQRAVIVLAGRPLSGQTRPSAVITNYLEGANADGTSPYELRSATLFINRSFNDRVAIISSN